MVLDDDESAAIVLQKRWKVVVVVLPLDVQHMDSVPRELGNMPDNTGSFNRAFRHMVKVDSTEARHTVDLGQEHL